MEKLPIDELFRRKLHDAEIAPGNAVWNTLQNKLGNRRVTPIWTYMAIASSLLLVGSFGWQMIVRNKPGIESVVARTKTPVKKVPPVHENLQLVNTSKGQKVYPSATGLALTGTDGVDEIDKYELSAKRNAISNQTVGLAKVERSTVSERIATLSASSPVKPDVKVAITQTTLQPKPLESILSGPIIRELPNVKMPINAERTLVVSIESPAEFIPQPIQTITSVESNMPKSGLGGLFNKIKKIKDGDAFALSTTKTVKSGRRGFGKLYDDVKESIQNNAADE